MDKHFVLLRLFQVINTIFVFYSIYEVYLVGQMWLNFFQIAMSSVFLIWMWFDVAPEIEVKNE